MKTVIEIQDMMIAKMAAARSFKTCSMLWANARKQATAQFIDLGFSDSQACLFVDDAEDIERLNFSCVDPSHIRHRAAVARELAGRATKH